MRRLAGMMGRTVHELECSISYKELMGWAHYWGHIEPYPELRQDTRSAMLCKIVADLPVLFSGKKPQSKLEDFLLQYDTTVAAEPEREDRLARRGANVSSEVVTGLFVLAGMTEEQIKDKERQRR